MTKYQERIFKKYVQGIEDLTADFRDSLDVNEIKKLYNELIETRVAFLKWFKEQIKS